MDGFGTGSYLYDSMGERTLAVHNNVSADSSNPNRESSVVKGASIQILEPNASVALCIFISEVPTQDDRVMLVSARLCAGDFYRDAIKESAQGVEIDGKSHHFESDSKCVVRLA
jgi:hypothetical protein